MFGQQLKAELTRADQERDAADETTDNYMYFIGKYSSELQNVHEMMYLKLRCFTPFPCTWGY